MENLEQNIDHMDLKRWQIPREQGRIHTLWIQYPYKRKGVQRIVETGPHSNKIPWNSKAVFRIRVFFAKLIQDKS